MEKLSKNLIGFALKTLAILALGALVLPSVALAAYGTNVPYSIGQATANNDYFSGTTYNPKPEIKSINPSYADIASGSKRITILGRGFVPESVARVNSSDRATTFIDSAHLFVQVTDQDMYNTDGFYVTVYNPGPGGGYSNAALFTVNKIVPVNTGNTTVYNNGNSGNYSNPSSLQDTEGQSNNRDSMGGLAAGVIFGGNSFLPSGIVQWILFAILVLLIVILVRKVFGAEDAYHAMPMKHD